MGGPYGDSRDNTRNQFQSSNVTVNGDTLVVSSFIHSCDGWRIEIGPAGNFELGNGRVAALLNDGDLLRLHRAIGAALTSAGLLGAHQP